MEKQLRKRKISLILFISILLLSPLQSNSQSQQTLLEKAYNENSAALLLKFFLNWNRSIKPVSETELLNFNDTVRQAYKVFRAFYDPMDIKRLGGSEWGNDIYKKVKFFIIQDSVEIYFSKKVYYTDEEVIKILKSKLDSSDATLSFTQERINTYRYNAFFYGERERFFSALIKNFRPLIDSKDKLPLYLNSGYSKILNNFLGNEFSPLGEDDIMNPAESKGESELKENFLEKYVEIWYGHWGGYWELHTFPVARSITFDSEMKYARIEFDLIYEGGTAFLENKNGIWTLISSEVTWIQ